MLCQRPYLLQKQHKNYILYSLLLLYLLIIIKQRYGKAEQQSFRAAEVCTRPPLDEVPLQSCSMPPFGRGPSALALHASIGQGPSTPCSMPPKDEALLHSCSMPSTGPGPFCKNFFCSRSSLLQNQQLYMLIKTLQKDNYHLSAYETQLQHPARTLTPSKFCYYSI